MSELPENIEAAVEKLEVLLPRLNEATDAAIATFKSAEERLAGIGVKTSVRIDEDKILIYRRYGKEDKFRFCLQEQEDAFAVEEVDRVWKLRALAALPELLEKMNKSVEIMLGDE